MNFTIFRWDRKTNIGKILRTGVCPDWSVSHQVREGESVLAGIAIDDTHHYIRLEATLVDGEYVVTGPGKEVCSYTADEIASVHGEQHAAPLRAKQHHEKLVAQGVHPTLAARFAEKQRLQGGPGRQLPLAGV